MRGWSRGGYAEDHLGKRCFAGNIVTCSDVIAPRYHIVRGSVDDAGFHPEAALAQQLKGLLAHRPLLSTLSPIRYHTVNTRAVKAGAGTSPFLA